MQELGEAPTLYTGVPVVLITTLNADGSCHLAPTSSAWWLRWRCILGLDCTSKTAENLERTGQCVLNVPSRDQVGAIDDLARSAPCATFPDREDVPGYRSLRDCFDRAGFRLVPSDVIDVPRADECPVQLEAVVTVMDETAAATPMFAGFPKKVELCIERLHLSEALATDSTSNDWGKLMMSGRWS
jgi:flavin reductase (DIM6/NTAB) family NADH-FMN oxidoreductase RutF